MRRGSALIMALWIIAVLSIMVLSFATEAHLQTGINVYVRERNRVNRLVEAGQALAEVVLVDFNNAKEWTKDEDVEDLLEDDRWYREKRALKYDTKCKIGPILLDEENPDSGTVTVEIETVEGSENGGININELYNGSDQNYRLRWEMLLQSHGLPLDFEVEDKDLGRVKLANMLIASWNDWRDEDDTATAIEGDECGAESQWYEDRDEDDKVEDEDKRRPRNGRIPDIQELGYIRGFRDFPAILTGGLIYPEEKPSEDNPSVRGIIDILGTLGSTKVNVNTCKMEELLTVPGIFDEDDDEQMTESRLLAQAIVEGRSIMPEDYEVDETRSWWPYKDWSDLISRLDDEEISTEAQQYLSFKIEDDTLFEVRITGESMGMSHTVKAKGYVKDKKVRYIEWRED